MCGVGHAGRAAKAIHHPGYSLIVSCHNDSVGTALGGCFESALNQRFAVYVPQRLTRKTLGGKARRNHHGKLNVQASPR